MRVAGRVLTVALLPFGERVVTVRKGPLQGARMAIDLAHEKTFWAGTYEPEVQETVASLELAGTTVWDIGAHAGFFSLLFARAASRVVAVEANPATAARLRRNVELNRAPIEVVEAAVADAAGEVTFEVFPGARRAQSAISETGTLRVKAITLDGLLERFGPPSFVKMDVEGAELRAIRAAPRLLDARPTFLVEVHHGDRQRRDTETLFADAAYSVEWTGWRLLARPR